MISSTQNELNGNLQALFSLHNRVAFITGATGHLGRTLSEALALAGATVILQARNIDKLDALAKSYQAKGFQVFTTAFDLRDEIAVEDNMADICQKFDRLDIVVNNAYSGVVRPISEADWKDFQNAFHISVSAAFKIIQITQPLLSKTAQFYKHSSSIINIASMYGMVSPDPSVYLDSKMNNPPYYGAAKAGLIQMTRYLACHLATQKIRVNAISPGPFPPSQVIQNYPDFYQNLCHKNPMNRIGKPEELMGALLFLASDASSYVTGINLPVDGGWTAW